MPGEFTIRPPRRDEADAIAAVQVRGWEQTYTDVLPVGYLDESHRAMRRRMWNTILSDPNPAHIVRIAEVNGVMTGVAMAGSAGEDAPRGRALFLLYLLAEHHGSGAGQALLDAVLGAEPAMLWVAKTNPRAIAFYGKNGFVFDGAEQRDADMPLLIEARMVRDGM
ncbi:GNAT family N-acetyltransferase [Microbacterium amylolyticum]|uniref:Ribosomal protein S18 acetylase RimI-like enzyme n=1 Tax=Microbacterium amylolyticum TaxID=936337 RepID=A0ABS4ZE81_9MICO|nr:GNAT family N-acetyltransferase [Microbacterium amylolyticum]MBP2435598.1 ribosomal protein S18 acetylase RimI-like enzyme [Microbacterium amylolyticum]